MTPKETVNEPALGWLREETYIAAAEVEAEPSRHSSTASGGFLHHGQADLRNSVIEAFTVRNDARNKGDVALVFGDGTAINNLTCAFHNGLHGGETCRVQWQNGDGLLMDNTLVMHSCARASLRGSSLRNSVGCRAGPTPGWSVLTQCYESAHWRKGCESGAHPQH